MLKIPQRKQRKRMRRSIDRSSHSERKKKHVMLSAEMNQLAWDISRVLPRKDPSDLGVKCSCPDCKRSHCKNARLDTEYCKECYWGTRGCIKEIKKIKRCNQCQRTFDERRQNG